MKLALVLAALVASSCALSLENLPLTGDQSNAALSALCDDVAHKFEEAYIIYMRTGVESPLLKKLSEQLASSHTKDIMTTEIAELGINDKIFMCTTCRSTVNVFIRMFRKDGQFESPDSEAAIKKAALDICNRLNLFTEEVCAGMIDFNYPIVRFIIDNTEIDSRSFCGTFMQSTFCEVKNSAYNWKLTVDSSIPVIEKPKSDIPAKGSNDLNVLHITDIHYDPLYVAGSLAECDEPMCCQRQSNIAQGTSMAAGYWGDYRDCDLPMHMIDDSLKQIVANHKKIDCIYHTGDVIDHGIWATSRSKNTKSLQAINDALVATFGNIPVYPVVGNHESHPLNIFAPESVVDEELSTNWLYTFLADLWSVWLPESTKNTILKGGYYTVSVRPGFRIIALNNNECYTSNFWILYDGNFPSEQLKWLHDTLLQAEKDNEYVHILGHVPSGSNVCWNVWSREFNSIVQRFSKTISGIFNGHTHRDEFSVFYSNSKNPVNIAWNGGSLTPYSNKNPNYKIYQVEPTSFQVVEHESWYFNLTEANLDEKQSPKWSLEYRLTEVFGLKDLSPASIDGLLTKFSEQPDLLRKYWEFHVVKGDPFLKRGCSHSCLKKLICLLARSDNTQTQRCDELQARLQLSLDGDGSGSGNGSGEGNGEGSGEGSGDGSGDGSGEGSGDDGGAGSIVAFKIVTIFAFYFGLKFLT